MLFVGHGVDGQEGIFRDVAGNLKRLVDLKTPVPGGGQFVRFDARHSPALSGERFAFLAEFLPQGSNLTSFGIFGDFGNGLERVITELDVLEGARVSLFEPGGLRSLTSRVRLDGSTLAFNYFSGNRGIVLVTVPEPGTLLLAGLGFGAMLLFARSHCGCVFSGGLDSGA